MNSDYLKKVTKIARYNYGIEYLKVSTWNFVLQLNHKFIQLQLL